MTFWLSAGIIFTLLAIAVILFKWGTVRCVGVTPVRTFTFIAILFTSGLDVGLIMFPLTEFAGYADIKASPEYAFANPLAIEFGFWGFLIWGFYFLTCFYFCVIEPKVKFFEIAWVKLINNIVIIGTCAFTAFLLLSNLPWYLPSLGDGESIIPTFYLMVFAAICFAVYSSTDIKYVRFLSISTTWLFIALIAFMWFGAFVGSDAQTSAFVDNLALIGGYFGNINEFILPLNDYHAFYLFWWFAWSIMIGQFVSRFVGGIKAWQLLLALLVVPSIPIAVWFSVLYHYHAEGLEIAPLLSWSMIAVGILFVINSLDSLTRLYTQNINLTVARLGTVRYIGLHWTLLFGLVLLYQFTPFKIEWVGLVVIAIYLTIFYRVWRKRDELSLPQQV